MVLEFSLGGNFPEFVNVSDRNKWGERVAGRMADVG